MRFKLYFYDLFCGVVHKFLFQSSAPEIPLILIQAISSKISDKRITASTMYAVVALLISGSLINELMISTSTKHIKYNHA